MVFIPVVVAALMLQSPPAGQAGNGGGEREQQSQQQASPPTATQQQSAGQPPNGPQPVQQPSRPQQPAPRSDPFSIDHLREQLERKPNITFVVPDPNVPRFKVEVEGKRWELPDLQTRMANAIPKMPVQVPFGGTMASDIARLNTPPEFFGSAPFTNGDLLKMEALSGAYGLAGVLIKRAIEARHGAELAQIREQIRQELSAIEEHNANVSAGRSDGAPDPKKVDKKKQDEKVKKKKKEEGRGA